MSDGLNDTKISLDNIREHPALYIEIEGDRGGCGGELLPVLDMGNPYLNKYPRQDEDSFTFPKAPVNLVWNQNSCLLQNLHTVRRSALYDDYWYLSSGNDSMVRHLAEVVKFAEKFVKLSDGDIVLDIASNDGTLLANYNVELVRVGYDPAQNIPLVPEARGINQFWQCFDKDHFLKHYGQAKIITACAVLYHMPDPVQFLKDVAECLAPGGVFVCEFTYLPTAMKNNAIDIAGHEHLMHLSFTSLEQMLEHAKLQVIEARLGPYNGGTLCCAITHDPSYWADSDSFAWLAGLREYEWQLGMESYETYIDWVQGLEVLKEELFGLLYDMRQRGKDVYLYGASTKVHILLQWLGINNKIVKKAVERNLKKVGRKIVGLDIPIISEEQARSENPPFMLVGPWGFKEEFVRREEDYLKAGGHFIFPLPKPEII